MQASNGNETLIASSCEQGCEVRLDSGTPYILGPSDDITTLQTLIGANEKDHQVCKWIGNACDLIF